MKKKTRVIWWVVVIAAVIALILWWYFTIWIYPERYLEAHTRGNMIWIQSALDKYYLDNGEYPAYLLGGDKEGWDYYNKHISPDEPYLKDPLIEGGYLESYPVNYFVDQPGGGYVKDGSSVTEFLEKARLASDISFDPRFGLNGDKIGNVLMEPIIVLEQVIPELKGYPRMCPGQFYYRAFGVIESLDELEDVNSPDDIKYDSYPQYVLGTFGHMRTQGQDAMRWQEMSGFIPDEYPYISKQDYYGSELDLDLKIPLRLPEVVGGVDPETPPFWPPSEYKILNKHISDSGSYPDWLDTCPDGMPDGVISIHSGAERSIPGEPLPDAYSKYIKK